MEEPRQNTLSPEMVEGCLIRSMRVISVPIPVVIMELEDRNEQPITLTISPGAVVNVNSSITVNLARK